MKHYTVKVKQIIENDIFLLLEVYDNQGQFLGAMEPLYRLVDPYKLVTKHIDGYTWASESNVKNFNLQISACLGGVTEMYSMEIYI